VKEEKEHDKENARPCYFFICYHFVYVFLILSLFFRKLLRHKIDFSSRMKNCHVEDKKLILVYSRLFARDKHFAKSILKININIYINIQCI